MKYTLVDLDLLVRTCYGEADGEPDEGIAAVAWVVRNRAEWQPRAWWGNTIGGVCLHPMQFDCWLPGTADYERTGNLPLDDPQYLRCERICRDVLRGAIADDSLGATHYKRTGTKASWDKAAAQVPATIIGHHSFYRLGPTA